MKNQKCLYVLIKWDFSPDETSIEFIGNSEEDVLKYFEEEFEESYSSFEDFENRLYDTSYVLTKYYM